MEVTPNFDNTCILSAQMKHFGTLYVKLYVARLKNVKYACGTPHHFSQLWPQLGFYFNTQNISVMNMSNN